MNNSNAERILSTTAENIVNALKMRFDEAKENIVAGRPVAAAAGGILDGTLNIADEAFKITGVRIDMTRPKTHKPILLVASKFGTWASELTLVAGVLLKAGYKVALASEDGSVPHLLGPSMIPGTPDGAWRFSVVSPEERDLAFQFLKPGTQENQLFSKNNILDLSSLAKPPQIGDYLENETLLSDYANALDKSMKVATNYDAICIAGGSGAIPGLMFDRGLHSLILAFDKLQKPIMAECNGGLAVLQTHDPVTSQSILYGRAVTTHSMLDEYQSGWGWTQSFEHDTKKFWTQNGTFDVDAYCAAEQWYQPGIGGNPLIDSEGCFRNAAGPNGKFFSPAGSPYSVVVDGHLITCRTTPDGYPGVLCLMAILDGAPPMKGKLFIDRPQVRILEQREH